MLTRTGASSGCRRYQSASRRSRAPRRRRPRSATPADLRRGALPIRLHQLVEGRRRLVEDGDALARQQSQELRRRAADLVRARRPAGRRTAARPRSPRPRSRRRRSGTASRRRPRRSGIALGRSEQPHDVAVRDHDALRAAGRARGVDDVGRMSRIEVERAARCRAAARSPASRRRAAPRCAPAPRSSGSWPSSA